MHLCVLYLRFKQIQAARMSKEYFDSFELRAENHHTQDWKLQCQSVSCNVARVLSNEQLSYEHHLCVLYHCSLSPRQLQHERVQTRSLTQTSFSTFILQTTFTLCPGYKSQSSLHFSCFAVLNVALHGWLKLFILHHLLY